MPYGKCSLHSEIVRASYPRTPSILTLCLSVLTEQNFKRLKSIIELNAFSIEAESVNIQLDVTSGDEEEEPPSTAAGSNGSRHVT